MGRTRMCRRPTSRGARHEPARSVEGIGFRPRRRLAAARRAGCGRIAALRLRRAQRRSACARGETLCGARQTRAAVGRAHEVGRIPVDPLPRGPRALGRRRPPRSACSSFISACSSADRCACTKSSTASRARSRTTPRCSTPQSRPRSPRRCRAISASLDSASISRTDFQRDVAAFLGASYFRAVGGSDAIRPVGARPRDRLRPAATRGVSRFHRVLARASEGRRDDAASSTRCSIRRASPARTASRSRRASRW